MDSRFRGNDNRLWWESDRQQRNPPPDSRVRPAVTVFAEQLAFDGAARVVHDPATVAAAVAAYAQRYRQPRERDDRVVIEIEVQRMMCNSGLR